MPQIDWDAQQRKNLKHADDPQPGDYWQEMLCPTLTVESVDAACVTVRLRAGGTRKMTRQEFSEFLRYDTMRDKTWTDIWPLEFEERRKAADGKG